MPETTPHQPQRQFTHLLLHTEYSLLDGACRIDRLFDHLKAMGQTACAMRPCGAAEKELQGLRCCAGPCFMPAGMLQRLRGARAFLRKMPAMPITVYATM